MRPHRQPHRSRGYRSSSSSSSTPQDHSHGYSSGYHPYEGYDNAPVHNNYQQDRVYYGWGGTAYYRAGEWDSYAAPYASRSDSYGYDARSYYYPDHGTYGYNRDRDHNYGRRSPRRNDHHYRDQRRNYHSSSRRPTNDTTGPSSSQSGASAGASTSSPGSSFTGRLFQHLDSDRAASSFTYHNPLPRAYNHRTGAMSSRLAPRPSERPEKKKLGPDQAYLSTSLEQSRRISGEDTADVGVGEEEGGLVRKLLVLDLNGTLVYRSPHRLHREHDRNRGPATGEEQQPDDVYAQFDPSQPRPLRTVHPRPYLVPFCTFLLHPDTKRWLDTMVWSSAQPHSVRDMVDKCFGRRKGELVAIWDREKFGLSRGDYGRKVQTIKDLCKPWEALALTGSGSSTATQKQKHSARTTLLLDDSPLKAHLQPYNHLCIKEYDIEMRRKDIGVRELEVARKKYAGVLEGKEEIDDVLKKTRKKGAATGEGDEEEIKAEDDSEASARGQGDGQVPDGSKRKRKEKKENKKKEKLEQQLKKLTEECENPGGVYDETLLAVVGILDAAKRESNVAAWVRSGGLIESLSATREDGAQVARRELSSSPEGSVPSTISASSLGSPRKKARLNEACAGSTAVQEEVLASVPEDSPSERIHPVSSSPPRESSSPAEMEMEMRKTGVPLNENQGAEAQLWFDHSGMLAYWASRGRKVLEEMDIEVVSGVVGPTG